MSVSDDGSHGLSRGLDIVSYTTHFFPTAYITSSYTLDRHIISEWGVV